MKLLPPVEKQEGAEVEKIGQEATAGNATGEKRVRVNCTNFHQLKVEVIALLFYFVGLGLTVLGSRVAGSDISKVDQ